MLTIGQNPDICSGRQVADSCRRKKHAASETIHEPLAS